MKKLFTRPPIKRIRHILKRMKTGGFPTTASLAAELEIGRRTVFRDMEYMRDSMGYEFEYVKQKHGFRLIREGEELPWPVINQGELAALILAERAANDFAGTPFEKPLHSALEKLSESMAGAVTFAPDELFVSFHDIQPGGENLSIFQAVSESLNLRQEITFGYRKLDAGRHQTRKVRPYHLACIKGQWYLFAYDLMRQDIRRFVLNRMRKVAPTGVIFPVPHDFSIQKLLSGSFGVHSATGEYDVTIRFTGIAATLVRERKWHASQKIIPRAKGTVELHLHLTSLEEIESWILGWGPNAQVLAPVELCQRIARKARQTFSMYEHPSREVFRSVRKHASQTLASPI